MHHGEKMFYSRSVSGENQKIFDISHCYDKHNQRIHFVLLNIIHKHRNCNKPF